MGKRVLISAVLILILFLISFAVTAEEETELAKIDIALSGNDLVCNIEYKQDVSSKSPSWQWFGKEGQMDGQTSKLLKRELFERGDGVICKYRDPDNSLELQKTFMVPNMPPVLEVPERMEEIRGKILNINPKVSDIDGDDVTFTFTQPFDEDGRWADTSTYALGEYVVTVTADDGHGGVVSDDVVVVLVSELDEGGVVLKDKKLEQEQKRLEYQSIKSGRLTKKFSLLKKDETISFDNSNMNIPISHLELLFNKDVLKMTIELRSWSHDEKPRKWPVAPDNIYSYIEILMYDFTNDDIDGVKLKFNVAKSWLKNFDESSVMLYKLEEDSWIEIIPSKLAESDDYVIFEAELNDLYNLAISAKTGSVAQPSAVKEVEINMEEGEDPISKVEVFENEKGDKFSTGAAVAALNEEEVKGGKAWLWIVALVIAAVIAGLVFTFKKPKKQEEDITQDAVNNLLKEEGASEYMESKQEREEREEEVDKELGLGEGENK
jgi:PGF-pre-PGF domain-containing protein